MKARVQEKEKAIFLRRNKGYSYNDILKEVSVAKSTLSGWLKDLPLTEDEKHSLKRRKDSNISRGRIKAAATLRNRRIEREKILFKEAQSEFKIFIKDPFFHVGIALYWAEGSKRNSYFGFCNSDVAMIVLMLEWIEKFFGIPKEQINARLYMHKLYAYENCEEFWSKHTQIPIESFRNTVYKPTGLLVKKRPNYKGCLRISITQVSFLRKTIFWQKMLIEHYKNK